MELEKQEQGRTLQWVQGALESRAHKGTVTRAQVLSFFNEEALLQQLCDEALLCAVNDTNNTDFIVVGDQLSALLQYGSSYVQRTLALDDYALLLLLAESAALEGDADFFGHCVELLCEAQLLALASASLPSPATLTDDALRTDGVASLLVSHWARASPHCAALLRPLKPLLLPCLQLPDAFELDPDKMRSPLLAVGARCNVEAVCSKVIDTIVAQSLPPFLLHLIAALHQRYDADRIMSVVILRVVTPAIVSPEQFGVVDFAVGPNRRGLVNVARVLQQIANNCDFQGDTHMVQFNEFMASKRSVLREFFARTCETKAPDLPVSDRDPNTAMTALKGLMLRFPLYADTVLHQLKSDANDPRLVLDPANTSNEAVRIRLLHRWSLTRNPQLLSPSNFVDSDSASEVGGGSAGSGGGSGSGVEGSSPSKRSFLTRTRSSKLTRIAKFSAAAGARKKSSLGAGVTEEQANITMDPSHVSVVEKLNSMLEGKSMFFTREYLAAVLRSQSFRLKTAFKIATKYHAFYTKEVQAPRLEIDNVEKMVLDGILLVDPRLLDRNGRRIMFMRPARFFPSTMLTSDVIKLLAYMTQRLLEDVRVQYEGFVFIADLGNWKMANFSRAYALNWFLAMIVMTVRLESFVIIDAPSWFGSIWTIIKVAMTKSFREKWTYVTRETVEEVWPKETRPPDIANGKLEIDLQQWCDARRIAEQESNITAFRHFADSAEAVPELGEFRRQPRSRTGSSPSISGRASPLNSYREPRETDDEDDSTTLQEYMEEVNALGIDAFDGTIKQEKRSVPKDDGTRELLQQTYAALVKVMDATSDDLEIKKDLLEVCKKLEPFATTMQ